MKNKQLAPSAVIIVVYLVSLLIWYLVVCVAVADPGLVSSDPTMGILLDWLGYYFLSVVICIVCTVVAHIARLRWMRVVAFLLPLIVIALVMILVGFSEGRKAIKAHQRRTNFWNDPPQEIGDLNLDDPSPEDMAQAPAFAHVFLLPESITEESIEYWDGKTLVYQTNLSPEEILNFYSEAYSIIGFELQTSGGGREYEHYSYSVGRRAYFIFRYSDDETQKPKFVLITTCRDLSDCWDTEDNVWEDTIKP